MSYTKNDAGTVLPRTFTFNTSDQQVRTVEIDGNPYFVAADICSCLSIQNTTQAIQSLDEDERSMYYIGRQGQAWIVNESGLYSLIFQSRKPEAKAFRKWVTSEVLPALRKTGEYRLQARKPGRPIRGERVNADILNLLWLIGESLEPGDISTLALELGVCRQTVSRVLNGQQRSSRVLMALYRKAQQNREAFLLYNQPRMMADRLVSGEPVPPGNHLPAVRFDGRKRGAQHGNQNARKNK